MQDDSYGSTTREAMKRSMEKPAGEWRPTNRRQHKDPIDVASWVVGAIAVGLIAVGAFVQIGRWWFR